MLTPLPANWLWNQPDGSESRKENMLEEEREKGLWHFCTRSKMQVKQSVRKTAESAIPAALEGGKHSPLKIMGWVLSNAQDWITRLLPFQPVLMGADAARCASWRHPAERTRRKKYCELENWRSWVKTRPWGAILNCRMKMSLLTIFEWYDPVTLSMLHPEEA